MPHAAAEPELEPERLSLAQAGRLTGMPKAYLRELVESGRLAVHLVPGRDQPKLRVTRTSLIEAGLLAADPSGASPDDGDIRELVALVREQSARITTLEEQRFQLGAQLGAALERIGALEERIELLPAGDVPEPKPEPVDASTAEILVDVATLETPQLDSTSGVQIRDAVLRLGEIGLQRSTRIGARLFERRPRVFGGRHTAKG